MIADTNVRQITLPKVRGKHYIVEYNRLGKQKKISCKKDTKIILEDRDKISFVGDRTWTNDRDIELICEKANVHSFDLIKCRKVTTMALCYINRDIITSLKIGGRLNFGRSALEIISTFGNLQELEICSDYDANGFNQALMGDDLFMLTKLRHIKSLKLNYYFVFRIGMTHIKCIKSLVNLTLNSPRISEDDFHFFEELPNLRTLEVDCCYDDKISKLKKYLPRDCQIKVLD